MQNVSTDPRGVTPVNYSLSIFDIKFAPEWQFCGLIAIEAEVPEPTTEVVLHAAGLKILKAEVSQGLGETNLCRSIEVADAKETLRLSLSQALKPGSVLIKIEYQASVGNSMTGFFRARYRALDKSAGIIRDGEDTFLLATHFEPCHARWAFPCFDEPRLKATFDVDIEIPEALTALSNMPVKDTTSFTSEKLGMKKIAFQRTPIMSTYLLAWAVGELEYIEAFTDKTHEGIKVPVRVYTPLGLTKYATVALECACKVLDLFQDLFKIDYPIPKCDNLVVPEFVCGATENWGLITYKPTKVLFDPQTSNNRVLAKAVYVVAHELAHQWFGNLVTMNSWSELWLNEGFATWAGYLAVDYLYPELNIWGQYVAEIIDDVLKLDSLPTTHAVEANVQDENAALQMFDQISYSKASSIIRMLEAEIGRDAFFKGLSNYLTKHAYQNARTHDLWDALSEASGINISDLMNSWIHTLGFPILHLIEADGQQTIKQQPILPLEGSDKASIWQIPTVAMRKVAMPDNGHLSINSGHVGYCCISYNPKLVDSIIQSLPILPSLDLVGIIVDMSNLTINNLKPTSEMLDFIWNIKDSRDCFVWLSISRSLSFLSSTFSDNIQITRGLKAYTAKLIDKVKHELQWTTEPITYTQAELNKAILTLGFSTGTDHNADMIQTARAIFARWASGDTTALHPSMRATVLSGCVGTGSKSDFEAVHQALKTDDSIDGQEVLLNALGSVSDPELADQVLLLAFSNDDLALQQLPVLGGSLGQNRICRNLQWEYVKRNWSVVAKRLSANSRCRDLWIEESLRHFSDLKMEQELGCFLEENIGPAISKPLEFVKASIRRNAAYKEQAGGDVSQWLSSHGFISVI